MDPLLGGEGMPYLPHFPMAAFGKRGTGDTIFAPAFLMGNYYRPSFD
jgi:hypothetical protein